MTSETGIDEDQMEVGEQQNAPAPAPLAVRNGANWQPREARRELSRSDDEGVQADDFEDVDIVLSDNDFEHEELEFSGRKEDPAIRQNPMVLRQEFATCRVPKVHAKFSPPSQASQCSTAKFVFPEPKFHQQPHGEGTLAAFRHRFGMKSHLNPYGEGSSASRHRHEPKLASQSPSPPVGECSSSSSKAPDYVPLPDFYYNALSAAVPPMTFSTSTGEESNQDEDENEWEEGEEGEDSEEDVDSTGEPDEEVAAVVASLQAKWQQANASEQRVPSSCSPASEPRDPNQLWIELPKYRSSLIAETEEKYAVLAYEMLRENQKTLENVSGQRGKGVLRCRVKLNRDFERWLKLENMFRALADQCKEPDFSFQKFRELHCDLSLTPYDVTQAYWREGVKLDAVRHLFVNFLFGPQPPQDANTSVNLSDTLKGARIPYAESGYFVVLDMVIPFGYICPPNFYIPGPILPKMVKRDKPRDHRFEAPNFIEIIQENDDPTLGPHPRAAQYPDYFSRAQVAYCEDLYWTERSVPLPEGRRVPPRPYDYLDIPLRTPPPEDFDWEPPPGPGFMSPECIAFHEMRKKAHYAKLAEEEHERQRKEAMEQLERHRKEAVEQLEKKKKEEEQIGQKKADENADVSTELESGQQQAAKKATMENGKMADK